MSRSRRSLAVIGLFALAVQAGCATGRGNMVKVDAGRATRLDILDKVSRILYQQGYEVQERRDTGTVIQFVTAWTTRAPFPDEASRGAFECRTRVTFEARRGAAEIYAISLRAENSVSTTEFGADWSSPPPTQMFREHIRDVADAIALEVDMGVRMR